MAVISTTLFWQFRFAIGSWFTDNTAVLATLSTLFPIMMIYQFGDSMQIAFANALRGHHGRENHDAVHRRCCR